MLWDGSFTSSEMICWACLMASVDPRTDRARVEAVLDVLSTSMWVLVACLMRLRLELFFPTTAANTEPGTDTFFVLRVEERSEMYV